MTSMTHDGPEITGGVDTHGLTHQAAVIDSIGRHLADREFPASIGGYRDLLGWTRSHGMLIAVGVEGPATTPNGCAPRPRSRTWPGSRRSPPLPAAPTATASTEAATGQRTTRRTPSCSSACAASGDSSPARSTAH